MPSCRGGMQVGLGEAWAGAHNAGLSRGTAVAEPRNRYSTVSLILHWLIAVMILVQVLLITANEATDGQPISREFIQIHKALGLTVLVLTLVRIGWRVANPAIPLPDTMKRWEKIVSRTTHVLFYVLLLAMPLTGWAAVSATGRELSWFGLFNWPLLPISGGRDAFKSIIGIHELVMKGMYGLIALHVVGALKHQFIDRDNVLHRMIPWIPRRP